MTMQKAMLLKPGVICQEYEIDHYCPIADGVECRGRAAAHGDLPPGPWRRLRIGAECGVVENGRTVHRAEDLGYHLTWQQHVEIDVLIAEHVMDVRPHVSQQVSNDGGKTSRFGNNGPDGWSIDVHKWLKEQQSRGLHLDYEVVEWKHYYSSDESAAWSVVEKLKDHLPSLVWKAGEREPFGKLRWMCDFRRDYRPGRWIGAVADTMPLAVCLAALKAVGKPWAGEEDLFP